MIYDIAGTTVIHKLALKSVGIRNKIQQEIFHCILQEALCHPNFSYIKFHLNRYNVRAINSNASPNQPSSLSNNFDFYASL